MCAKNQRFVDSGLDGLCESPHDNPPSWASVLTAYLDESMESNGDGHVVVAGFVGKKSSWVRCVRTWRRTLKKYGRERIHLKELRFHGDRYKPMLADLGGIPSRYGLRLVYGTVHVASYSSLVSGKIIEVGSEGYLFAFQIALLAALKDVPKGQRLEVICESQKQFANRKDNICATCAEMPEYKDKHGMSKLAKWSSMSKSSILEPADFAAFAMLSRLLKPNSKKALLCSPILENKLIRGASLSGDQAQAILIDLMKTDPSFMDAILTREAKTVYINQLPTGEDFQNQVKDFVSERSKVPL